jgi:5-methylcytosine-specific restriction endonuclease McrA
MGGGKRAKARRRAIMEKSQANGAPHCSYCGIRMSRKAEFYSATRADPVGFFTMDHVLPRACGGCNDQRNLVGACRMCNQDRGDMPLDQFIESLGDKAVITVERAREMMREAKAVTEAVRFGVRH